MHVMSTGTPQIETVSPAADKAKLAAAALLVVGAVAAYYLIKQADWIRWAALIVLLLAAVATFFLSVINVVYAFFDTFAIVDAATQGGPGKDTAILVYKVYYDGFKALDLGSSAAQSVVLMVIVIALTVVQFRFVEKKVNY